MRRIRTWTAVGRWALSTTSTVNHFYFYLWDPEEASEFFTVLKR